MDDLLKASQLSVASWGQYGVAALAIVHTGFQLYPLPSDQQGLDFSTLKVTAALVPNTLMQGDSDEEGSDSGGEDCLPP